MTDLGHTLLLQQKNFYSFSKDLFTISVFLGTVWWEILQKLWDPGGFLFVHAPHHLSFQPRKPHRHTCMPTCRDKASTCVDSHLWPKSPSWSPIWMSLSWLLIIEIKRQAFGVRGNAGQYSTKKKHSLFSWIISWGSRHQSPKPTKGQVDEFYPVT